MKKIISLIALLILFVLPANALDVFEDESSQNPIQSLYEEQLEASGGADLTQNLPDGVADDLDKVGIDIKSPGSSPDISSVFSIIFETAKNSAKGPMGVSALLLGILVLCAVLEGAKEAAGNKSLHNTAAGASSLAVCLVCAMPIAAFITSTANAISSACNFAGVFVPVFAGVLTVSGQPMAAAGYSAFMMAVLEGCSVIIGDVVIPLLKIFLAVSVTASIAPSFKIDGVITAFDKNIKWILSFFASLMVGTLGVTSLVSATADNAASKALKFAVSSGVPVIGSMLGDALATVQGCIGMLRSSVGGFGIIAIAFIFIPPMISCFLWRLCIGICGFAAEAFGIKPVQQLLKSIGAVLSILLSVLTFTAVVLILSSALVLRQ